MSSKGLYDWDKDEEYRKLLDSVENTLDDSPKPEDDGSDAGLVFTPFDQTAAGSGFSPDVEEPPVVYDAPDDDMTFYTPAQSAALPPEPEYEPQPAAAPVVPQETLDDDLLDTEYSAVLEEIARERKSGYRSVPLDQLEEDAYSQTPMPPVSRGREFRVNITDENFDQYEEELPPPPPPPEAPGGGPTGGSGDPPQRPRRHRRKKRFLLLKAVLFAAIVVGVSVYLSGVLLNAVYDVFGLQKEDIEVEVDIPVGADVQQIADILEEKGIISEPFVFEAYSRLKNADDLYQHGTYTLNQKMSYDEIIRTLKEQAPSKDIVRVTIPEGLTALQIGELLEKNGVCGRTDFLNLVRSGDIEHEVLKNLPTNKYRYYALEGYLFPDTYDFYTNESVGSVVRKFLDAFQKKVLDDLTLALRDTDLTLDELITLASIIQREASDTAYMNMVSSVFHNRLDNPDVFPQLQSDPTISYVTDNILPQLDIRDDAYYGAYSTYICNGLPIGPICSPGVAAIRAAIYPSESDYYFFVTDADGNFFFAATDAEHERNKEQAGID